MLCTAPHPAFDQLLAPSAARSAAFRAALAEIELVAPHDKYPVLLEGGIGTGKTFLARHLHDHSPRARALFTPISLATRNADLASSDLFGHEKGSFTGAKERRAGLFQSTRGGTLFLDEIGKASPEVQEKLLQVLDSGIIYPVGADRSVSVDVRIIAASNIPLERLVDQGQFLPDLHSRLNCFSITIPSLSERKEDIPDLVEKFLARHAPNFKYERPPQVARSLLAALQRADWRYNVRDLEHAVIRTLKEARGAPILQVQNWINPGAPDRPVRQARKDGLVRKEILDAAIETGTIAGTAMRLGIGRKSVRREVSQLPEEERMALLHSGPQGGRPKTYRSGRTAQEELERKALVEILLNCKLDIDCAARAIGKSRSTVYRLLQRFGISITELQEACWATTPVTAVQSSRLQALDTRSAADLSHETGP